MTKKFYSLNGIVNFALTGSEQFSNSFRYRKYLSDQIFDQNLDFVIRFDEFKANLENCRILDDKFYVKPSYLYSVDEYKLLKWKVEISNLEGAPPVLVNFDVTPRWARNFSVSHALIEGFIVDALINLILIKKKYALLHASCVSKNGKSLLFLARGGGGKTTMVLKLLKLGYKFISDNFTIVLPNNKTLGFIEPLNIFTYNIDNVIYNKMNVYDRLNLKLKYLLYKLSKNYIKIFSRLDPCKLFQIEIKETEIDAIFVLLPKTNIVSPRLVEISKEEFVERACLNQRLEFPYFDEYLSAYSYEFPNSELFDRWMEYKNNLNENIKNVPIYRIEMPLKYNDNVINEILCKIK